MGYKRPEDQYRESKARGMIEELKSLKVFCTFSTIVNYRRLDFQGHEHAGMLNHPCILEKGHDGNCMCICGVRFKGY